MTCEFHQGTFVCARGRRLGTPPKPPHTWNVGDRVTATIDKKHLSGVVLRVKPTAWMSGQLVKLRVAEKNPFADQWLAQEYRDWVAGTLLVERTGERIPGLDEV